MLVVIFIKQTTLKDTAEFLAINFFLFSFTVNKITSALVMNFLFLSSI